MRSFGAGILIGALLFGAAGLFVLGIGLRNVYRGVSSKNWPTASGTVIESTMSKSVSRNSNQRTSSTSYNPNTIVQFRVGDRDYTTGTRRFGQFVGSGDASEAMMEQLRFPMGKSAKVWYDPGNPAIATMRTGFGASALMLPFVGVAFSAMALLILGMGKGAGGTGMVLTVFGMIFCGIGGAMLVPASLNLWHAKQSTTWPTTTGRIVYGTPLPDTSTSHAGDTSDSLASDSARVVESPAGDTAHVTSASLNDSTHAPDSLQTSSQYNRLVYRYDVNGVRYFGNVRQFGQLAGSSDADWASSIAASYPLGHEATIAYSPTDPNLSVLEPGVAKESLYLPAAGFAFLLFGLAVLRWAVPALS